MKKIIKEICDELNIKCTTFSKDWCYLLEKDGVSWIINGYKFPLNDHAAGLVADDKYALYELLKLKNVPIIEHKIMFRASNKSDYADGNNDLAGAIQYLKENGVLVIKPNNGTCGNGVARVYTENELVEHINDLFLENFSISLCPYYDIKTEYRTIILDGKIECMYGKERPIIYGDGIKTVKELLIDFNPSYFSNESHFFNKKIDLNYVPKKDEKIEYNWQHNLAKGSQVITEIPLETQEKIKEVALKAYEASNLKFCSVDVIETNDEFLVMEINSGVTIKRYINLIPNGYDVAKQIYKNAIMKLFNIN